jgi:hypothetical protein
MQFLRNRCWECSQAARTAHHRELIYGETTHLQRMQAGAAATGSLFHFTMPKSGRGFVPKRRLKNQSVHHPPDYDAAPVFIFSAFASLWQLPQVMDFSSERQEDKPAARRNRRAPSNPTPRQPNRPSVHAALHRCGDFANGGSVLPSACTRQSSTFAPQAVQYFLHPRQPTFFAASRRLNSEGWSVLFDL